MLIITVGSASGRATKKKGAEELKWENLSAENLVVLASTVALFGGAATYTLSGALAGERAEEFLSTANILAASPHTFVFEEEKLLKRESDILAKAGATIEKKEKKAGPPTGGFDQFGVASALGAHDKKKLWLALTQALRAGEKAEALAGLMVWKARQMKDVGLARELTFMYHDSHRGMGDLELLLERFALNV